MPKQRKNIFSRLLGYFVSHPWLKLIALVLAIIVWLYVRTEIGLVNY